MLDTRVYTLENNQWQEQKDAIYPLTQIATLDESLDRGNVTIKGIGRRTPYPAFTKCKVVCKDIESDGSVSYTDTQYYYLHDKVDQLRMIKPYLYDHTLMMIEPTKLLERYIIPGMSVTQPLNPVKEIADIELYGTDGPDLIMTFPSGASLYSPPVNGKVQIPVPSITTKSGATNRYEMRVADSTFTLSAAGYVEIDDTGEALYTVGLHNPSGGVLNFSTAYDVRTVKTDNEPKSVADVVDILLATTPFRRTSDPQPFVLDESLRAKLSKIKSCEFKWSCKMTLFECLHDVGKFIGAMPRLIPSADDDRVFNTVSFDFFGNMGKNIDALQYAAFSLDQQESNYCSELETYAENLIAQSDESQSTVTYPSKNGWITPRTTQDIKLSDKNAEIVLPDKIYKITKFLVTNLSINHTYWDGTSQKTETISYGTDNPIDLTECLYETDAWELLPSTDASSAVKDTKQSTIKYKTGSNVIDISYSKRYIVEYYALQNAIKVATGYTSVQDSVNGDIRDYCFQVEYIPLSSTKLGAVKATEQPEHGTLTYNQLAQINDSTSLGRNMWGSCQALGTPDMQMGIYFDSIASIPKIGDIFEDYIVTTVERTFKSIKTGVALLTLSKDFNRLNEHIAVNKAFRQWAIPADSIEKDLRYNEYCILSDSPSERTSIVTTDFINRFANTLQAEKFNGLTEIDCATLHAYNKFVNHKVLLSVQSRAFANSLAFSFKTKDNYSAGLKKSGDEIIDVPYANVAGTFTGATIDFGAEIKNVTDFDALPDMGVMTVTTEPVPFVSKLLGAEFVVHKDAGEQIGMVYQMHVVPGMLNVVIGPMLTEKNPLVREFDWSKSFKCWRLTQPLSKFAMQIYDEGEVDRNITFSVAVENDSIKLQVNGIPSDALGWAITDNAGQIYLAENANSGTSRTLYFNFKKSRS